MYAGRTKPMIEETTKPTPRGGGDLEGSDAGSSGAAAGNFSPRQLRFGNC